jgi:FkbM family methyltransferase
MSIALGHDAILKLSEVLKITGLSKTALDKARKAGTLPIVPAETPCEVKLDYLRTLCGLQHLFPRKHVDYLHQMKTEGIEPSVIYDVGANVLHWTREAKKVWPCAVYIAFDAMHEAAVIYGEEHIQYYIGLLSDHEGKEVSFYVSPKHPGGNSYYKENYLINEHANEYFLESNARKLKTVTLDTAVRGKHWPAPDLIKMDIQGAEMDVLKGAQDCLETCKDLIVELQTVEYNKGAPLRDEVIAYIYSLGFKLRKGPFCDNGPDGDYHFNRYGVGGHLSNT